MHLRYLLRNQRLTFVLLFIVLVNITVICFYILLIPKLKSQNISLSNKIYPELAQIHILKHTFPNLKTYFTALARTKGAVYAFEVLRVAPIQPGIDMHLLAHYVGDILYQQKKGDGIAFCTEDFRNACSHSIVTGLFSEQGEVALREIESACKKAPGRSGYLMCFHGLGHGILAYHSFDMKKTILTCGKIHSKYVTKNEAGECVGGAVMEIISGGFHDRETWEKERGKYLFSSDPFHLCSKDVMPEEARNKCYIYLGGYLQELAGLKPALSKQTEYPEIFAKAFTYCEALTGENEKYRNICYGAFGKDFVVFAKERDIRNIENMTDDELKKVYTWCSLAKKSYGINSCIESALAGLYWSGDNDPRVSVKFCSLIPHSIYKSICYSTILNKFASSNESSEVCTLFPDQLNSLCKTKLSHQFYNFFFN